MIYDEIGVTDEPVEPNKGEPDQLKIKAHIEALETFIIRTKTPLTIGIQGSWGTGKTSLLKMLEHKFMVDSVIARDRMVVSQILPDQNIQYIFPY